ncbi:MAG: glutaminyl-peptide cyclotransferase [Alistipes sp.]|nr:glutaminyl-peptide cyclotransferase [Alistipes sp.]
MRKNFWLWLSALLLTACTGKAPARHAAAETPAAPRSCTYRIVRSYPRPTDRYTQGLLYAEGMLWEGTGQYGESRLLRTDLESGACQTLATLPRTEFGEGIALLEGKLYQLTWTSNKCRVYEAATGRLLHTFSYPGEGWGLTDDGTRLYMSDGSEYIRVIDPDGFRTLRRITVTYRGEPLRLLNELEWIGGRIWANVYTTDLVAVIDPSTGRVEATIDLGGLLPEEEITPRTDVLNGIAYDAAGDRIFVTGKNWGRIFEVEIIEL